MTIAFALLLATVIMLLGASPAAATPITVCGKLEALTRHVTLEGPGSATIDGRTFRLSSALSTNETNRIDADVRVDDRVCLTGNLILAPSPSGTVELLENFVLSSCTGPSAPAACAATLPSTSTSDASQQWPLGRLLSAAAALLGTAWFAFGRRRDQPAG